MSSLRLLNHFFLLNHLRPQWNMVKAVLWTQISLFGLWHFSASHGFSASGASRLLTASRLLGFSRLLALLGFSRLRGFSASGASRLLRFVWAPFTRALCFRYRCLSRQQQRNLLFQLMIPSSTFREWGSSTLSMPFGESHGNGGSHKLCYIEHTYGW